MAAVITMAPMLNIAADTCKAGRRPQASITSMVIVRLLGISGAVQIYSLGQAKTAPKKQAAVNELVKLAELLIFSEADISSIPNAAVKPGLVIVVPIKAASYPNVRAPKAVYISLAGALKMRKMMKGNEGKRGLKAQSRDFWLLSLRFPFSPAQR